MKKLLLAIILININLLAMSQVLQPSVNHLTDEACAILCKAARDKSREMGLDISFAIADADGMPRLFQRFGNALVLSATLVPNKAYTAAITCTPTAELLPCVADGADLMGINTCDSRITVVPGGVPLIVNGQVIGAIGVGGGTKEQDLAIASHILSTFHRLIQ